MQQLGALLLIAIALWAGTGCSQSPEVRSRRPWPAASNTSRRESSTKPSSSSGRPFRRIRISYQPRRDLVAPIPSSPGMAMRSGSSSAPRRCRPDSLTIAVDLGRALVQAGAWKEAETQAALILGKEPQNLDGLYISAMALLGQGKVNEAQAVLQAVPAGSAPRPGSGDCVSALQARQGSGGGTGVPGRPRQNPQDVLSLAGLGSIELTRNQPAEALKLYEQAKAIQPGDPRVRQGGHRPSQAWASAGGHQGAGGD